MPSPLDIRVGCCGFALARAKYFRRFSPVEVQQTFCQPPRVATLQRRREQATRGFEFTLKERNPFRLCREPQMDADERR